jgi:two-component system response regulator ChvI
MDTIVTDGHAPFETGKAGRPHLTSPPPAVVEVVLVDDSDLHWEAVEAELVQEGVVVHSFSNWQAMLAAANHGLSADLVVLDWRPESMLGVDLLSEMRALGFRWPLVLLRARHSPIHERLALRQGAVDCVDKARATTNLAVRLRMIANQGQTCPERRSDDVFHYGRLVLRSSSRRALWDDVDVGLTISEFKIVRLLASNAGSFITYRQIYDRIHHVGFIAGSGKDGYRVNVRSAIKRIRDKFRNITPDFNEIQTYPSFGYCWGRTQAPTQALRA